MGKKERRKTANAQHQLVFRLALFALGTFKDRAVVPDYVGSLFGDPHLAEQECIFVGGLSNRLVASARTTMPRVHIAP